MTPANQPRSALRLGAILFTLLASLGACATFEPTQHGFVSASVAAQAQPRWGFATIDEPSRPAQWGYARLAEPPRPERWGFVKLPAQPISTIQASNQPQ